MNQKGQPEAGNDSRVASMLARTPWLAGLPREVTVLAAIAFCVALGFGIVAPALPVFAKTFGVSAFLAAAVISVFALMRLISSPGAGFLVNRIGERVVLASGLIIVAVSSMLAGFSQSYDQLLVLRGVGGIGSAMFTVSAMALLLRTAGPDQRGRAAGAFQAGFLFGGITGPAVGGLVVGISIRAPFFVYAATLGLATAVALIFLRSAEDIQAEREREESASGTVPVVDEPVEDHASQPIVSESPGETEGVIEDHGPVDARKVTLGMALRNGGYRAALVANLSNGFVSFGIRTSLVPLFVVEFLHRGAGLAGVGFLVAALTQALILLPAGRIADQRGRRPALIIGAATSTVGLVILTVTNGPILFVLAMAVLGLGTAFLGSAPAAVVGDVMGEHRGGIVVAAFQMIADVGSILGPLLAGLIVDSFGYHWAFATAVVVMLLAMVFAVFMPETKPSVEPLEKVA